MLNYNSEMGMKGLIEPETASEFCRNQNHFSIDFHSLFVWVQDTLQMLCQLIISQTPLALISHNVQF